MTPRDQTAFVPPCTIDGQALLAPFDSSTDTKRSRLNKHFEKSYLESPLSSANVPPRAATTCF